MKSSKHHRFKGHIYVYITTAYYGTCKSYFKLDRNATPFYLISKIDLHCLLVGDIPLKITTIETKVYL